MNHTIQYNTILCSCLTNKFVSLPSELSHLTCAAYVAGIINGYLDSTRFYCKVSAHQVADESDAGGADMTVFLIKFTREVMERETRMA